MLAKRCLDLAKHLIERDEAPDIDRTRRPQGASARYGGREALGEAAKALNVMAGLVPAISLMKALRP